MDEKEVKFWRDKGVIERSGGTLESAMLSYRVLGVDPENIELLMKARDKNLEVEYDKLVRTQEQIEAQIRNEVFMYLATKERGKATEIIVKYIMQNNHIYTTKNDEKPEIWIYNNGIYSPNGESIIKEITRLILKEAYTSHLCSDIIAKIRADTFIEPIKFFSINYRDEILVQNGILNVSTRELYPYTPNKIFFNKCPVIYNPIAKCDVIDSFISDILANSEDRLVFYEIGGFCLLKEYTFEKAFMFVGSGRNGKGKSLELIKRVVGPENCYSLPLAALQHDNADVAQLFGKMVNLAGDIGISDLKDTSMFKGLTGRDLITAKRKFLTAITFENYAKFIFACNDLPRVYDLSKGFWDRWVLLEFPFYFASKEEWEALSEEERNKLKYKLRDEDIINKIATPEQLSGLLNAFLDGLDRLKTNHKFSSTKGTEEIKNMWIRKSDSFMAFCMDFIEEDYQGYILKKDIRTKFAKYCREHKLKNTSDKSIKVTLENNYGVSDGRKEVFGGYWEFAWEGIKWK